MIIWHIKDTPTTQPLYFSLTINYINHYINNHYINHELDWKVPPNSHKMILTLISYLVRSGGIRKKYWFLNGIAQLKPITIEGCNRVDTFSK